MINKEFLSSYFYYGVDYACGCKDYKRHRNEDNQLVPIPKKICFGWTGEHTEMYTLRALKGVSRGLAGEEWRQLLLDNPKGSVDYFFELYRCRDCGYWINEENLSFYLPNCEKPKFKTVRWEKDEIIEYRFFKKYRHLCPKCCSEMEKIETRDFFTHDEDEDILESHTITHESQLKLLSDMHLVCPNCNKEIIILDYTSGHKTYYVYGHPETVKPYHEWVKIMQNK